MKKVNDQLLNKLLKQAEVSPRLRDHHLLHDAHSDPVQKLVVGMLADSYVRPHMHPQAGKFELIQAFLGSFKFFIFDDAGIIIDIIVLSADSDVKVLEIPENTWHALLALEASVFMEIKPGPFHALTESDFAAWAPTEGHDRVSEILDFYRTANIGDQFT